jgi:hypothetical protein
MSSHVNPTRRFAFGTLVATFAAAAGLALAGLGGQGAGHAGAHDHASESSAIVNRSSTAKADRLHDKMRKLWEDHIVWTRLAIISFAEETADLEPTVNRLLRNQDDIGDAVKPFYGHKAGERLTALLKEHINGAVDLLVAAKSGDQQALETANAAWYRNGRQVADFLHRANPANWARGEMRGMMKMHLDQTLSEASHRLGGEYRADIRDYDAIHHHILEMADELSDGLVAQFPGRFR